MTGGKTNDSKTNNGKANGGTNCRKEDLLLYAVTDRSWLNGRSLGEQVEEALAAVPDFAAALAELLAV